VLFISFLFFPKNELIKITPDELKASTIELLNKKNIEDSTFVAELIKDMELKSTGNYDSRIIGIIGFVGLLILGVLFYRSLYKDKYPRDLRLDIIESIDTPNIGIKGN